MSLLDWFAQKKKEKKDQEIAKEKINLSPELWAKCPVCTELLYKKKLAESLFVCSKCRYHFRLDAKARLELIADQNTFQPLDEEIQPRDFLNFTDSKKYSERIKEIQEKTDSKEAVITGFAEISGQKVYLGIMDFAFMGGSMGSVVGEKVTRLIEYCLKDNLPLVIVCATGGARMQEGILSLMQMAKTSAALAKLNQKKAPYIAIFSDPTTAGVLASFGMLADIIIAEPGALIGFAGPRVIEQTIRQKLPKGFQRAEYLLAHGMVDLVVERPQIKETIAKILKWCLANGGRQNG